MFCGKLFEFCWLIRLHFCLLDGNLLKKPKNQKKILKILKFVNLTQVVLKYFPNPLDSPKFKKV